MIYRNTRSKRIIRESIKDLRNKQVIREYLLNESRGSISSGMSKEQQTLLSILRLYDIDKWSVEDIEDSYPRADVKKIIADFENMKRKYNM